MPYRQPVGKRIGLTLLACAAMVLSACGDRTEISDLNIVVGFGIDQAGKNVRVTAQVRNAGGEGKAMGGMEQQGEAGSDYVNYTASGDTVEEAVQNLRRIAPRRLYFAHNTVVVFGGSYAKKGIRHALDYLIRNREFRRTQHFCVTSGKAEEVLKAKVGAEQVNALGLQRLLLPEDIEFFVSSATELHFLNDLLSPSRVPLMTWVDVEQGKVVLKGAGLFRGDQLTELLPNPLAQSLYLLRGELKTFTLVLPCRQPNQKSMYRVRFIGHELRPVQKDGGWSFHFRIDGNAEPVTMCSEDYLEQISEMKKGVNRELAARLREVIAYLQRRRLDAVMLGTKVYRVDPQWWRAHAREWPDLFARVPVTIEPRLEVLRPGMNISSPLEHYTPEQFPPKSMPRGVRP